MPTLESLAAAAEFLQTNGLINACEKTRITDLGSSDFPFHESLALCDSIHLHVKVDDANAETLSQAMQTLCGLDYSKAGFVKYRFAGGVNLIFSSIPVSEDELIESMGNQRKRPFLDHIGIDLRREADPRVQQSFAEIPAKADAVHWAVASQGCGGQGVHCCHVEVNAKHWVYPNQASPPPQIPLEFALGALKINDVSGGCDLRPMDPVRKERGGIVIPNCHT